MGFMHLSPPFCKPASATLQFCHHYLRHVQLKLFIKIFIRVSRNASRFCTDKRKSFKSGQHQAVIFHSKSNVSHYADLVMYSIHISKIKFFKKKSLQMCNQVNVVTVFFHPLCISQWFFSHATIEGEG